MTQRKIDPWEKGFMQGIACASAILIREYDQTTMALTLLRSAGFDSGSFRKFEIAPYDAEPCRKILRTESRDLERVHDDRR